MTAPPPMPALPRRLPTQARARATVDAILEATAALLAERGYEGVNTNVIAERAGVKPPAVYRYFPNKFVLYHALAEKLQGEVDVVLDEALKGADDRPLAELIDALIDGAIGYWGTRPAFAALWSGSWAFEGETAPALLFGIRTVARFTAATTRFRALGPQREFVTLTAAMNIGMAVVNLASIAPPAEKAMLVEEAKRAVLAYLTDAMER